jgi:tRNA dimethylallyltransferase
LYLRLLSQGLAPLPPADVALRARLLVEEEAAPGVLHARLRAADPDSAARISPRDRVRLVRALEVEQLTGRPLSAHLANHVQTRAERPLRVVFLDPPDAVLRAGLIDRTEAMLRAGLVEEARALRERFGPVRPLDALGYKEALELIDGRFPPRELGERIVRASRRFARRQRTWFNKATGVVRVDTLEGARALITRS